MKRPKVVNARSGGSDRWVYGINAVRRRLEVAPESVHEVCVAKRGAARVSRLLELVAGRVPIHEIDEPALARLVGTAGHQGIAARTQPFRYTDLDRVLLTNPGLLLVVDQMQDPQNFGALIRTAAAAGVGAVIIPRDGAVGVTPAVEKASAGAVNDIAICQVVNIRRILDLFAGREFWRVGLVPHGGDDLYSVDLPKKLVVVLGGEGGIRPLVAEACDFRVSIPMAQAGIESLNASAAAAITLFELMRRRLLDR